MAAQQAPLQHQVQPELAEEKHRTSVTAGAQHGVTLLLMPASAACSKLSQQGSIQ
jgi:hypothetical protein